MAPEPLSRKLNRHGILQIRRDIPFMRHALVFNIISLVTFVLAVFFLIDARPASVGGVHRRYADGSEPTAKRPICSRCAAR
jgi:hypothetical protein